MVDGTKYCKWFGCDQTCSNYDKVCITVKKNNGLKATIKYELWTSYIFYFGRIIELKPTIHNGFCQLYCLCKDIFHLWFVYCTKCEVCCSFWFDNFSLVIKIHKLILYVQNIFNLWLDSKYRKLIHLRRCWPNGLLSVDEEGIAIFIK